jgi:hypothetical protein
MMATKAIVTLRVKRASGSLARRLVADEVLREVRPLAGFVGGVVGEVMR